MNVSREGNVLCGVFVLPKFIYFILHILQLFTYNT